MDANTDASQTPSNTNTPPNKEESKKFIRTFSSDIDILKKGGTPDLTPFTARPEPVTNPVAGSPTPAPEGKKEFPSFHGLPDSVKAAFDQKAKESPIPNVEGRPEEYVRTFSSDMKTLKKGGVPDLSLFRKASVFKENMVVASKDEDLGALQETRSPSVQEFAPEQAPTPEERLITGSPVDQSPIVIPKVDSKVLESIVPSTPSAPLAVKTYAGDFSEKVKETNATPMTVLAAEQDAQTGAPQISPPPPKPVSLSSRLYIAGGVALLMLSLGGIYAVYTRYGGDFHPVLFEFGISSPIFVDEREQISGTGSTLMSAIVKSMNRSLMPGSVRLLYTASSTTNVESIFSALHPAAPDILRRNVNASGSIAGIVSIGGNQSPFFILSVDSYAETFSGMLSWELTIQENLKELYTLSSSEQPETVSSTTTTTRVTRTVARPTIAPVKGRPTDFVDEVVANHDVRVYRDANGNGVMIYGYWDPTTLIIARDTAAFTELLQRLATSRAR